MLNIPNYIQSLVSTFNSHGYEAFCVGGCVRDSLLGRVPTDWDVATNAPPETVTRIFPHAVPTGILYGTVTVITGGHSVEVTTYRKESAYLDGRRPSAVTFGDSLEDDLERRDFTINALAYSPKTGVIDYANGLADIERKIIRTVGKALDRFTEDHLRILRALRFASVLGFEIEARTERVMLCYADLLLFTAEERVRSELDKLICGENAQHVLTKYKPMLAPFLGDYNEHGISEIPREVPLRLGFLMREMMPANAQELLKSLKYDNGTCKKVTEMLKAQIKAPSDVPSALVRHGYPAVQAAFIIRNLPPQWLADYVSSPTACWQLSKLAINGSDILTVGIAAGKVIGQVLDQLLLETAEGKICNKRSDLIERAEVLSNHRF